MSRANKGIEGILVQLLRAQKVPNGPNTERPTGHLPCMPDNQSAPGCLAVTTAPSEQRCALNKNHPPAIFQVTYTAKCLTLTTEEHHSCIQIWTVEQRDYIQSQCNNDNLHERLRIAGQTGAPRPGRTDLRE